MPRIQGENRIPYRRKAGGHKDRHIGINLLLWNNRFNTIGIWQVTVEKRFID
jgi:hypothetical protein